ncbi:hypothetical protein HDU99_006291 [Rhizoclosmatium hyalinum]|nr:hypothetical protein HDU99_006291 [Rhizoclosmatium hyalinum]
MTPEELQVIRTIFRAICPVSMASGLSLITCVILYKRLWRPVNKLQACIALCEIVMATIWTMGTEIISNIPLCTAVGILLQFFTISMTSFSFCITLYCYLTITYSQKVADKYWMYYFCYGWGLGVVFTALLIALGPILNRGNVIGDGE